MDNKNNLCPTVVFLDGYNTNPSTSTFVCTDEHGRLVEINTPQKKRMYKRPNYCCEKFKENLENNIDYSNIDGKVTIALSCWGDVERMEISRCPFCGKKIKIIEVEEDK